MVNFDQSNSLFICWFKQIWHNFILLWRHSAASSFIENASFLESSGVYMYLFVIFQCPGCLSTFHRVCRQDKRCPKCVRIHLRTQSNQKDEMERRLTVTTKESIGIGVFWLVSLSTFGAFWLDNHWFGAFDGVLIGEFWSAVLWSRIFRFDWNTRWICAMNDFW